MFYGQAIAALATQNLDSIFRCIVRSTTRRGAARTIAKTLKISYKDAEAILALPFYANTFKENKNA